jgi:hypothetical protein
MESRPAGMVASALQSRIAYLTKQAGNLRGGKLESILIRKPPWSPEQPIGIGGTVACPPLLTTVRAGPHTAVRRVELCVNSQAFCLVRR